MASYFENRGRFNYEREKYFREKTNLRLKYAALAAIFVSIVLIVVAALCLDKLPIRTILIMRGCAGVFALIFMVLVGILIYRVNVSYFADKHKPKHKR